MPGIPEIHSYRMPSTAQLPQNIVNWAIDPNRAVLLVHDMQRFFVRRIPVDNPGRTLLENSVHIRQQCSAAEIPVAYTIQPGNMTADQRGLLKDFWGPGMTINPEDRQVIDALAPVENDWLFTKWRYSAFCQSDLLQRMREAKRDQLIICGVYAHIGILSTAIDAFSHDIETFLVADAIAAFSLAEHMMAIQHAAACCAMVIPTHRVAL